MKKVLVITALLIVGCGGNQSKNATTEESGSKKMSTQMADDKKLPELKMVMPQSAPIKIDVITAEKDPEFLNSKKFVIANEE